MELKLYEELYIGETEGKGRGVFAKNDISPMKTVEISSVLMLNEEERELVERTELYNYIFEWGDDAEKCCVAWGYISVYNHSFEPNCDYFMSYEDKTIMIKSIKPIKAGDELTINYNGETHIKDKLWFDTK